MYCLLIKTFKNDFLKSVTSKSFESFEEAYNTLREVIKELAFTKNDVFDGNGNITEMKKYFKSDEEMWNNNDDYMKPFKYLNSLALNTESNLKAFKDNNSSPTLSWSYKNKVFKLYGDKEGPDNGVLPIIQTNISTKNTNHCYLYINDNFGGNWKDEYNVHQLEIDLIKVEE